MIEPKTKDLSREEDEGQFYPKLMGSDDQILSQNRQTFGNPIKPPDTYLDPQQQPAEEGDSIVVPKYDFE